MTPVKQTKLYAADGAHHGNCLAACLASLCDVPLWMVPEFDQMFSRGDYRERAKDWVQRFFYTKLVWADGHDPDALPDFYIACGQSVRGIFHACIYRRGELAHDPHFSNDGLKEVEYCYYREGDLNSNDLPAKAGAEQG